MQDIVRKEAKEILQYFKEQGVDIKIISGDNPITVSNIAKKAGVENWNKFIDLSTVKPEEINNVVKKYTVFGRVLPTQKQDLIKAIKQAGHTVAMTGDGVNDVLALKEADCSIAMASGSDAARSVSQIVLLDSNFGSMKKIVAEGRRTINNIERSSELFLTKTLYACILAILFVFISMPYPFKPIQFSLINTVTIGIPSFVLALQPNKARVKGKFLKNVLKKALPTSLTVVCNILLAIIFSQILCIRTEAYTTICIILTAVTGFSMLARLCRPANLLRAFLWLFVVGLFLVQITLLKDMFYICTLNANEILLLAGLIAISECIYMLLYFALNHIQKRRENDDRTTKTEGNNGT